MIKITLFLILASVFCQNNIQGPITTSLTATASYAMISRNAQIVVVSFYRSQDVEIYEKAGSGYQFKQTLPGTSGSLNIAIGYSE